MPTRSTIPIAFDGNDLDPSQLIAVAGLLKLAIDRANALVPAARVAIAASPMGDAARALGESLITLASTSESDDIGDDAIPADLELIVVEHVYDGAFTIPFNGGAESISGVQAAVWVVKKCYPEGLEGSPQLQAHRLTKEVLVWGGGEWDASMDPETHEGWLPQ